MVTGLCALVMAACGQETTSVESESGARLIVYPMDAQDGMFAIVRPTKRLQR